jgi:tripeptidyl-peptidase-2
MLIVFLFFFFPLGHIERKYIEVPHGASWVEATMNISSFDTPRRFFVDTVQVKCLAYDYVRLSMDLY